MSLRRRSNDEDELPPLRAAPLATGMLPIVPALPGVVPRGPVPGDNGAWGNRPWERRPWPIDPNNQGPGRAEYRSGVVRETVKDMPLGRGKYTGELVDGVPNGEGEFVARGEGDVGLSPDGEATNAIHTAKAELAALQAERATTEARFRKRLDDKIAGAEEVLQTARADREARFGPTDAQLDELWSQFATYAENKGKALDQNTWTIWLLKNRRFWPLLGGTDDDTANYARGAYIVPVFLKANELPQDAPFRSRTDDVLTRKEFDRFFARKRSGEIDIDPAPAKETMRDGEIEVRYEGGWENGDTLGMGLLQYTWTSNDGAPVQLVLSGIFGGSMAPEDASLTALNPERNERIYMQHVDSKSLGGRKWMGSGRFTWERPTRHRFLWAKPGGSESVEVDRSTITVDPIAGKCTVVGSATVTIDGRDGELVTVEGQLGADCRMYGAVTVRRLTGVEAMVIEGYDPDTGVPVTAAPKKKKPQAQPRPQPSPPPKDDTKIAFEIDWSTTILPLILAATVLDYLMQRREKKKSKDEESEDEESENEESQDDFATWLEKHKQWVAASRASLERAKEEDRQRDAREAEFQAEMAALDARKAAHEARMAELDKELASRYPGYYKQKEAAEAE